MLVTFKYAITFLFTEATQRRRTEKDSLSADKITTPTTYSRQLMKA